jgi:hypothetical protein
MTESRNPPLPVKRALRREAFFGCCVCGDPIVDYHNIVEYGYEKHFRIQDMMVLCPNHHRKATKGSLKEVEQRRWKASPFNKRRGNVNGKLSTDSSQCKVQIGSTTFIGRGRSPLLMIDDVSLLELSVNPDGYVQLTVSLFDQDGALLARIFENDWESGNAELFDINADDQVLSIRANKSDIRLVVDMRTNPITLRAELWFHGAKFKLGSKSVGFLGHSEFEMHSGIVEGHCLIVDTATRTFQIMRPEDRAVGVQSTFAESLDGDVVNRSSGSALVPRAQIQLSGFSITSAKGLNIGGPADVSLRNMEIRGNEPLKTAGDVQVRADDLRCHPMVRPSNSE